MMIIRDAIDMTGNPKNHSFDTRNKVDSSTPNNGTMNSWIERGGLHKMIK